MFWRRPGHLSAFYRKKILLYLLKVEIKLDGGVGHRYPPNLRGKFNAPNLGQTVQWDHEDVELHFEEKQKVNLKPSDITQL